MPADDLDDGDDNDDAGDDDDVKSEAVSEVAGDVEVVDDDDDGDDEGHLESGDVVDDDGSPYRVVHQPDVVPAQPRPSVAARPSSVIDVGGGPSAAGAVPTSSAPNDGDVGGKVGKGTGGSGGKVGKGTGDSGGKVGKGTGGSGGKVGLAGKSGEGKGKGFVHATQMPSWAKGKQGGKVGSFDAWGGQYITGGYVYEGVFYP
jgi:hypothetical protein